MFSFNNDDLLLNLLSEGIGILITVIIVSPLISWFVSRKQTKLQRNERLKMSQPLKDSFKSVYDLLQSIEHGSDADFIEAGLEAVRRKVNKEIKAGPYNPSYELALGNPHFILRSAKQRIDTQIRYINSLVDLFAPHFRTQDAYLAAEYLENLRISSQDLNFILEKIEWLLSATESFEKFSSPIEDTEEDEKTGDEEGNKYREDAIKQMRDNIESEVNKAFARYKTIDTRADKINKSLDNFIKSLKS